MNWAVTGRTVPAGTRMAPVTALASVLLALAAPVAVADWVAVRRRPGARVLEYAGKPLTLALLIAVAASLDPADEAQRAWFVMALILCLAGDVYLMLPRERFVAGLGSFLLGHVAYVVGFAVDPGWSGTGLGVGLVVVAAVAAVLGRRVLGAVRAGPDPGLAAPVAAYTVVISVMVAAAVGTGDAVAIAGAGLFFASDATIALTRFERSWRWGPLFIMVTYHLGQALLVLSLL